MQEVLLKLFDYNPETGILRWRERSGARKFNGRFVGREAGTSDKDGYRTVSFTVDGVYRVRRAAWVIWVMQTGVEPVGEIDHVNRIVSDNRWCNLREATRSEQTQNRVRKKAYPWPPGVTKKFNRYQAAIAVDKKWKYLGMFATAEEAHQAYLAARERLHPRRPE